MENLIKTISEFSKNTRGKKIISTVSVTFTICLFFIWLIVGLYLNIDENDRNIFLPMLIMYLIFPLQTIIFAAKKIYVIYTKGYEDTIADE